MKILGISSSHRKWGNTDILVRQAMKGATDEGAETEFLRLTDYPLQQCRGCLSCLFKERNCIIDDCFSELYCRLQQADGIIFGSPIYCLGASGTIQTLLSRLFYQQYTGEFSGKSGLVITVGGMPGWEGWAPGQVLSFFLSLRIPVIDQFSGYGQGPGEILYDKKACDRALKGGLAMAKGIKRYIGEKGVCPFCHFDWVIERDDKRPWCMICNIYGAWILNEGKKDFKPEPGAVPRWDSESCREHFEHLILTSKKRYMDQKADLTAKLEKFKNHLNRVPQNGKI
jgi:multimeric flavodoxin WrbA